MAMLLVICTGGGSGGGSPGADSGAHQNDDRKKWRWTMVGSQMTGNGVWKERQLLAG